MFRRLLLVGMLLTVALSACVPSLNPLYTEKDLISDPALVGRFAEPDSSESWTFEWDGERAYDLTVEENGKQGLFKAHLLELDGHRFLDLFPKPMTGNQTDFYRLHLVPTHTFFAVGKISDQLQMSILDPNWLEDHLTEKPDSITYVVTEDGVVLTDSTEHLQAFILENREAAFDDFSELSRAKPGS